MKRLSYLIEKYKESLDAHMKELLRGSSIALMLKVVAATLAFVLNVALARLLGAESSGVFFLAFTIALIAASIGRVGMENALVRFVAANVADKQPGKVLGVYQKAMTYSLIVSVIISVLLYLTASWISQVIFTKPELEKPLTILSMAVVPLTLYTLHAYALQGLKKIAASISVLSIYTPLLTCIIAIVFIPAFGIDAAVVGYLISAIITLLLGRLFWKMATAPFNTYEANFDSKELLTSSIPLLGVVILNMVITWSPLLFMGVWESNEDVGIFSVASRVAMLTSFILVAVNSIAAPKYAALYQQGDMDALGIVARNSTKIMVLFASPILLLLILMPEWIMSIFGETFKQGAIVLVILAIGQFVNVATGSVGYLLMMTGNERLMRKNLLFSAMLGILLNLWLIPNYGILGGALAASLALVVQNLIAAILVWKVLNVMTLPWLGLLLTKNIH